MAPCIILSSGDRLIRIVSDDCALRISSCRTCLYFVPNLSVEEEEEEDEEVEVEEYYEEDEEDNGPPAAKKARPEPRSIESVLLRLSRSSDDKTIAEINLPYSIDRRLRIDSLLPLVFDAAPEPPRCTIAEESCDLVGSQAHCTTFSLGVFLRYRTGRWPGSNRPPSLAAIHSACVSAESEMFPVSKEVMSLDSSFFTTLFYGEFSEKKEKVKAIHDMEKYELELIVRVLHTRHNLRVATKSLELVSLLRWADYCGMLWMLQTARQLLLQRRWVPGSDVKALLIRADKLPSHLDDVKKHLVVITGREPGFVTAFYNAIPAGISPSMAQMCLNRVQSQHRLICSQKDEKISALVRKVEELQQRKVDEVKGRKRRTS